jgi:hypothetical protein
MTRLKLFLFIATLAAMVAVFSVIAPEALAADIRQSVMTSSDAGTTNTVTVGNTKGNYAVQCASTSCYRVSNDAGLPDCALDPILLGAFPAPRAVEMSGNRYINALALDAGNPDCRLLLQVKNPTSVK